MCCFLQHHCCKHHPTSSITFKLVSKCVFFLLGVNAGLEFITLSSALSQCFNPLWLIITVLYVLLGPKGLLWWLWRWWVRLGVRVRPLGDCLDCEKSPHNQTWKPTAGRRSERLVCCLMIPEGSSLVVLLLFWSPWWSRPPDQPVLVAVVQCCCCTTSWTRGTLLSWSRSRAELGHSISCTFYVTVIGDSTIPVSLSVRVK